MANQLIRSGLICCIVGAAACGGSDATADAREDLATTAALSDTGSEADALPADDDVWQPDAGRTSLPSSRIYYTLTDHGWYARAEPLLHDQQAWQPAGMPITASASDMTRAGEYDGVEYYVLRDDDGPALYVPVFEGWWLRFRPDTTASAVPAPGARGVLAQPAPR